VATKLTWVKGNDMEFIVGEYKVATCEQGWAIYRKHTPQRGESKGEVKWRYPKYYGRLEHVLPNLLDRMIREENVENAKGIEEMKKMIESARKDLADLGEGLDETIANLSDELKEHLPVLNELGSTLSEINQAKKQLKKL
jgi:septal ring factor EnvC (AmiA/AmiB activator)